MIEVNFKDRVPTHAGRVKLTPVAGQADTYTMERADEPREQGTPLDKATFDSIIKSRLTGRFYQVTPSYKVKSSTNGTTTPLPTSNWVLSGTTSATSGIYKVVASSAINSDYSVEKAVDGKDNTSWAGADNTGHTYTIIFPIAINIKRIGLLLGNSGDFTNYKLTVQGSNNGETWTNLLTVSSYTYVETEYTLTTTGEYSQYRFSFDTPATGRIYIFKLTIPEWVANSYTVDFQSSYMPLQWENGQRVTIQIPTYAAFVVDSNTFNGIKVNTILLSGRKYELRYNGTSFDAKEV